MDVDLILRTFNAHRVDSILIGGMNFFLVHEPVTTFDVDLWVADTEANLPRVHDALAGLQAEVSFSPRGDDWRGIATFGSWHWLRRRALHCLNSPAGPLDVFREVPGLEAGYEALSPQCALRTTPTGVSFRSLSDSLMIACQLALPPQERKHDRLRALGYVPGHERK